MSDHNFNIDEGFDEDVKDQNDNVFRITKYIGIIFIGLAIAAWPTYWAWTTRGALEKAAMEGVVVIPLEYKRTLLTWDSLGYKLVLERLTEENNISIGDVTYQLLALEAQRRAMIHGIKARDRAHQLQRKKIELIAIQQEKSKSKQLLKEVGEYAGLDDEDRKSLEELLTTEINDN